MPDDDKLPPADEIEELDPPDDNPEPGDDPPGDDETNADDPPADDAEPGDEPGERRTARGQPDDRQRDRRRTREEEFQREVDRAVERRLSQNQPTRTVDYAAQHRELEERRRRELEDARLQGPEAYADTRDRHLREDYRSADIVREARHADDRDMDRFNGLCDKNSIYSNIRDDVDREVARLRSGGAGVVNREAIANFLLGKRYAARAAKQGSQQRKHADSETRRQTVRAPASTASQHSETRGRRSRNWADKSVEEMERELASQPIRTQ